MGELDIPALLEIRAKVARDRDHQNAIANDHALVDKHGRELFGTSVNPDLTPIDHRYVAPRNVLVEWVGERSPYQSETVIAVKSRGMLDPILVTVLDQAALKCTARVDGLTTRSIGERDGLSQTYKWGSARGTYVVEMPSFDADRLMSIAGSEFRIREKGYQETRHEGDDAWRALFAGLRKIAAMKGLPPPPSDAELSRIRYAVSEPEKLVGVRRDDANIGDWRPL